METYRLPQNEFTNSEELGLYLQQRLRLNGEAVALKWSMEPPPGVAPYAGGLKLAHCQFMQRARFLGETYCVSLENNFTGCSGYTYIGLGDPPLTLETGELQAAGPSGPGLFASAAASRRSLQYYYRLEPHTVRYFTCAPLS